MGVGHSNKKLDRMAQNAIDEMNRPGPSRSTGNSGSSNNRSRGSNNTKVKDDSGFWLMVIIVFVAVGLFMKFF